MINPIQPGVQVLSEHLSLSVCDCVSERSGRGSASAQPAYNRQLQAQYVTRDTVRARSRGAYFLFFFFLFF